MKFIYSDGEHTSSEYVLRHFAFHCDLLADTNKYIILFHQSCAEVLWKKLSLNIHNVEQHSSVLYEYRIWIFCFCMMCQLDSFGLGRDK